MSRESRVEGRGKGGDRQVKILLDMDGVLVDFVGGACRAHGVADPYETAAGQGEYDMARLFGIPRGEFWEPMRCRQFWVDLEPTDDCAAILHAVIRAVGFDNVCLLTNPCTTPEAASGKMEWIKRYLPAFLDRFLIGPAKHFCAGQHTILIDDYDQNIRTFSDAGGGVILVPRPWNSAHMETQTAAQWIKWCLRDISSPNFQEGEPNYDPA